MKKFFNLFLLILLLFNFTPAIANTLNVTTASYSIVINGEKWEPNNPIISINGKTYIPLTEIADLLDVDVSWNEKKRQVEINKADISYHEKIKEEERIEDTDTEESEEKTYSSYLEWLMDWYGIDEDEEIEESTELVEETEDENDYSFSLDWLWSWDDDSQIKVSYGTENSTDKSENNSTTSSTSSTVKKYVASKSGSKYHLTTCSSAKKIKAANKTYFASEANAKSAGYSACSICIN